MEKFIENIWYISVAVLVIYVGWLLIKYKKVLPSISHSVYLHGKDWLFFAFMTGIGLPLILYAVNIQSYFMVISGALFILCGASPYFHEKTLSGEPNIFESRLHSIGAEGGMLFFFLHLAFDHKDPIWTILMAFPLYIAIKRQFKNHTYWLELIGFALCVIGEHFKEQSFTSYILNIF